MRFVEADLPGVFLIEPEPLADERGFFARVFDKAALRERGLTTEFPEHSTSFNPTAGTLRGMHYQDAPHAETKIVRCTAGSVHDVLIDLRSQSPRFRSSTAFVLSADNRRILYIPPGIAHGFMTLGANSELHYLISEPHQPGRGRGVRWNDPAFGIVWPREPLLLSTRDASYPDFRP